MHIIPSCIFPPMLDFHHTLQTEYRGIKPTDQVRVKGGNVIFSVEKTFKHFIVARVIKSAVPLQIDTRHVIEVPVEVVQSF
jgi:hypothetical protein